MSDDTDLRAILGADAVGGWLQLPGTATAEIIGSAGFDAVCVDTQHGLIGEDLVLPMLQALSATGAPALVRVAWNDPVAITAALDRGAHGVVVPMVNSAQEAAAAASACRWPPHGTRSYGPTRLGMMTAPPADPVCVVMVETTEAVAAVDDIVAVDGVDAVFVGPSDLALSMGKATSAQNGDPEYDAMLETVVKACRARDLPVGIFCASAGHLHRFRDLGFTYGFIRGDGSLLADKAAEELAASRPGSTTPPITPV
ncbi:HpcH/HpaI aldolase/citrate lyase family protein [Pseudonocardia benzenivorans]|uniref:HpcH/HpaI aldolase n=2 Tax=Pseudonocardia TaxID=1847 RepID=F4CT26_PSEUX|nr:aldolase/citrate lyase family protein [Pseudonocardia dioxanivorans]AEA25325.1 HpcH/HpaI aldolase [Pseudonocardia dioxanivorans CB1190]